MRHPGFHAFYFLILVACSGGSPVGASAIQDLFIETFPESPLVVRLRWSTPTPSDSTIEFGEFAYERRTFDPGLVTEHEQLLVGLHPDSTTRVRVSSTDASGLTSEAEPVEIVLGPLPFDYIAPRLLEQDEASQPGWTLMNVTCEIASPALAIMVDEDARPVWFYSFGEDLAGPDVVASLTAQGKVLLGPGVPMNQTVREVGLDGSLVWDGPVNDFDPIMHHFFQKLSNGNYFTTLYETRDTWAVDVLTEMDADQNPVWTWSFFDHASITPAQLDYDGLKQSEYTHINSAHVDLDDDIVCAHAKYLSRVYKIDRASGDILWTFGEEGDFSADPDSTAPWFHGAHGVRCLPDEHLLLFDNETDVTGGRAVEYRLDLVNHTSEIVWQYPPEGEVSDLFSRGFGDTDRLANGNTLITVGEAVTVEASRILEVSSEGELLWEMDLGEGSPECPIARTFAAERIPALSERILD